MKKILITIVLMNSFFIQATLPERGSFKRKPFDRKQPRSTEVSRIPKIAPSKIIALITLQRTDQHSSYINIKHSEQDKSFIERISKDRQPELYCLNETSKVITQLTEEQKKFFFALKTEAIEFAQSKSRYNNWMTLIHCCENGDMLIAGN